MHSTTAEPQQATTPVRKRSKLRTDIQALRALAVLLVVLNHLWPTRLPGGYVGVDVFFVISGFLITAHLLGEIRRTNRVSLPNFYARRARRLLPAALLVALVTLAATVIWLPAERWPRIAREAFASSAYFENWLLTASSVNYSDRGQAATPFQHYWSLSVEEQFYVLWPLTLVLLVWLIARRTSSHVLTQPVKLILAVALIAAASLAFSIWQTDAYRAASYFNTFGRVWEFMVGAILAVAAPAIARWLQIRRLLTLQGVVQIIGYSLILFSAVVFDEATAFPGPWALLPVLGTVLVIAAGPDMPSWTPVRASAWRPVQYLGDISYSLYLWHWPVIVIAPFVLARGISTVDRIAMLVLSVLLAALTKHFIEDPGRKKLFARARPRRTLVATLLSVATIGALAYGTTSFSQAAQAREQARIEAALSSECFGAGALEADNNCANPFGPALFPAGAESEAPWGATAPECETVPPERQILADGKNSYVECDFSAAGSDVEPYRVWLIGDSHAEHWQGAIYDIARGNGWEVKRTMQGGCPSVEVPLVTAFGQATDPAKQDACLDWIEQVSNRVVADAPDLIIVSNFASAEQVEDGTGRAQVEQLRDGLESTLARWADAGAQIVVIRDVPSAGSALGAECVSTQGQNPKACTAPQDEVLPGDPMVDAVTLLNDDRITFVDLTPYFCKDGTCSGVIGGLPVFYDYDHISSSYSRSLAPMLSRELGAALGTELAAPVAAN